MQPSMHFDKSHQNREARGIYNRATYTDVLYGGKPTTLFGNDLPTVAVYKYTDRSIWILKISLLFRNQCLCLCHFCLQLVTETVEKKTIQHVKYIFVLMLF